MRLARPHGSARVNMHRGRLSSPFGSPIRALSFAPPGGECSARANRLSSCLCPNAPHPRVQRPLSRRPGPALLTHLYHGHQTRSARAEDREVIEPSELADKTVYTRPHTVHCRPSGIYVAALGNREEKRTRRRFVMDHEVSSRSGNGTPPASGPLAGRRLLVRFLLLSLARLPAKIGAAR
jgi:56kDa selenium binding protein (SBP56)